MRIDRSFSPQDDWSANFAAIRPELTDANGAPIGAAIRLLAPHYGRVWRDIGLGYAALAMTCVLTIGLAGLGPSGQALAVVAGSIGIGLWIAYLQLFIHEAAHANLAASARTSDLLSDLFIGWMSGASIRKYRSVHLRHHTGLGTTRDTENTYFRPLDPGFLIKGLTGWRAIEVLRARARLNRQVDAIDKTGKADSSGTGKPDAAGRDRLVLLGGIAIHAAIIALLLLSGGPAPALAWLTGTAMVFPFFGALRQLLEHRSEAASDKTDYAQTDHGAYSRMFGTSLFARIFGAAGFNRHLLHHWEPQVSYTRFDELEAILRESGMGPVIDARSTTYAAAFRALYKRH